MALSEHACWDLDRGQPRAMESADAAVVGARRAERPLPARHLRCSHGHSPMLLGVWPQAWAARRHLLPFPAFIPFCTYMSFHFHFYAATLCMKLPDLFLILILPHACCQPAALRKRLADPIMSATLHATAPASSTEVHGMPRSRGRGCVVPACSHLK